ncbi:ABC transporter permease [Halovivax cerinus]|uniref:ABC transporter permease n=1 Tax=Halovivax cerinus TaxID=1487865 RepID=UPI0021153FA7|nr:ABC transporter permease [Halovivax cerinus]
MGGRGMGRRLAARTEAFVRIALARVRGQLTGVAAGKATAIVFAVSVTLALLVVVSGLALALVGGGVATDTDADVVVEPTDGGSLSSVNGIERPRLANATAGAAEIRDADGVSQATPVFVETVPVRTADEPADDAAEYVRILAVGVDPESADGRVAGLSTAGLDADGTANASASGDGDDGPLSDGLVLSETAADRLDVTVGDTVVVASGTDGYPVTVTAVESVSGDADTPVALVDRSALLAFAGASEDSLADRILVWGEDDAAVAAASTAFPSATVESTGSTHPADLFDDELALATSLVATVIALVVCALFIATTAGLAVAEDRPQLAVLSAVGFSNASRLAVVATTVLATVLGGSILGFGLGVFAGYGVNALSAAVLGTAPIVVLHPLFAPYTMLVAVAAGLLALPYPLSIAARTDVLGEIDG